jgi:hypothetical protein
MASNKAGVRYINIKIVILNCGDKASNIMMLGNQFGLNFRCKSH